jgi:D-alanine-D-alanine ligase
MVRDFKRWLRSRRIGVLMGGTSAERSISLKTGKAILQSLQRQGFKAKAIDAAKPLPEMLKKNKINYAYLALHGTGGEDGRVQGLLEWLKIPYTGSGVLASALAMDKVATKRLFDAAKLPTAPWVSISKRNAGALAKRPPMPFPLVVKPASQGSAVGISIVKNVASWSRALSVAFRYDDVVLVESFLRGPEITVGVIGDQTLPIIEILPQHDRPFYDFHAKYAQGGSRHILPARISAAAAKKSIVLTRAACRALGIRAVARVDLIVDQRRGPSLLEVNTIPGMTETSLLPEAARAAGIDFDRLVLKIAEYSYGQ